MCCVAKNARFTDNRCARPGSQTCCGAKCRFCRHAGSMQRTPRPLAGQPGPIPKTKRTCSACSPPIGPSGDQNEDKSEIRPPLGPSEEGNEQNFEVRAPIGPSTLPDITRFGSSRCPLSACPDPFPRAVGADGLATGGLVPVPYPCVGRLRLRDSRRGCFAPSEETGLDLSNPAAGGSIRGKRRHDDPQSECNPRSG